MSLELGKLLGFVASTPIKKLVLFFQNQANYMYRLKENIILNDQNGIIPVRFHSLIYEDVLDKHHGLVFLFNNEQNMELFFFFQKLINLYA